MRPAQAPQPAREARPARPVPHTPLTWDDHVNQALWLAHGEPSVVDEATRIAREAAADGTKD